MRSRPFLMIEDVGALREKLMGAKGSLAAKWLHFQKLAEHQAAQLPLYSAFVGLITGNGKSVQTFRRELETKVESWPSFNRTIGMQYHVYCQVMSFSRWALAFDWVADYPAMGDFDTAKFADTLLDALYTHAYPVMRAREPSSNNQIASMLLSSIVAGHIFGQKRGRDPRARRLFEYAIGRLRELTELAEPWFVGEGSTYIETVNVPVGAWLSASLEWLGLPVDRAIWTGLRKLGWGLIGPGGLSLPWDNYGYHRSFGICGLALLARETGDPAPLAAMDHLNLWHGIDSGAWGEDTRIWTLIWWPEDAPEWPSRVVPIDRALPSWMHPRIGGALHESSRRLRVFQAWDVCQGNTASLGRTHADANSISMDLGGIPLILDGVPKPDCRAFDYHPQAMLTTDERSALVMAFDFFGSVSGCKIDMQDYIRKMSHGCVGGSNALVFENEPWHFPRGRVEGRGTVWAQMPGLQAVGADCAEHYRQRYDVNRVERTTVLMEGRYVVTLDRVLASKPLNVTWQAFTRSGTKVEGNRVLATTPEGPRLVIVVPADDACLDCEKISGFPLLPDTGSMRVSWAKKGMRQTLATLLWSEDDRFLGAANTEWEGGFLETEPTDHAPLQPCSVAVRGSWSTVVEALAKAEPSHWRWLRLKTVAPSQANYLRLLLLNHDSKVWLNRKSIQNPEFRDDGRSDNLLPWTFPVSAAQSVDLTLTMRPDRGRLLVAPPLWFARIPISQPCFSRLGPANHFHIQNSLSHGDLDLNKLEGSINVDDEIMDADAALAAGYDTDALWLVKNGRERWYAIHATWVKVNGLPPFQSDQPSHVWWDGQRWNQQINVLPNSETVAVDNKKTLGSHPWQNKTQPLAPPRSPGQRVAEALYAIDAGALTKMLHDEDFRVRMAAAERLGEIGDLSAIPSLIKLLESELACNLYPTVPDKVELKAWDEEMAATGRDAGVNRFRTAQFALLSLERLKARVAAPLARRILEESRHFYPLHHAACVFLGSLGNKGDVSLLEKWSHYPELNTQEAAVRALAALRAV